MFNSVKVDDKLEISELYDNNSAHSYLSKVEAKLPDKQVVVYMPIQKGQIVKLPPTKTYILKFFSGDGTMICFKSSIIKYIRKDGFNFIIFQITSNGERVQRREFFRHSCLMPFKFLKTSEIFLDEDLGMNMVIRYDGIIKDIGGGGIRFVSNEDIEDEVIRCEIMLDESKLVADGNVISKTPLDRRHAAYKYQYRVQFTSLPVMDQEKIVQFIFNEQRRMVRKTSK